MSALRSLRREPMVPTFAGLCLLALLLLVAADGLFDGGIDTALIVGLRRLVDHHGPVGNALREWMVAATALGAFTTLALIVLGSCGFLSAIGRAAEAGSLSIASADGVAAADLLKIAIARPRPDVLVHWANAWGWSFPSGHSA